MREMLMVTGGRSVEDTSTNHWQGFHTKTTEEDEAGCLDTFAASKSNLTVWFFFLSPSCHKKPEPAGRWVIKALSGRVHVSLSLPPQGIKEKERARATNQASQLGTYVLASSHS